MHKLLSLAHLQFSDYANELTEPIYTSRDYSKEGRSKTPFFVLCVIGLVLFISEPGEIFECCCSGSGKWG